MDINHELKRWWGNFTAMTPIMQTYPNGSHQGPDKKNEIFTRTWNLGGGRIPVISGDSFRGRLRRALAEDLLNRLGVTPGSIPVRVAHLLFVGGSLMSRDENTLDGRLAELRHLLPPFSLLGGTALGGFAQGRLCAGEWVAHSAQTPPGSMREGADVGDLPDAEDLFVRQGYARNGRELYEMFSRDEIASGFTPPPAPATAGDSTPATLPTAPTANDNTPAGGQLHMPHSYEAVAAGTVFSGTVALRSQYELTAEDDAIQRACLRHGIEIIAPDGRETLIGARASCGWGVVRYEWEDLGDIAEDTSPYLDFVASNCDAIRKIIGNELVPTWKEKQSTSSRKAGSGRARKAA